MCTSVSSLAEDCASVGASWTLRRRRNALPQRIAVSKSRPKGFSGVAGERAELGRAGCPSCEDDADGDGGTSLARTPDRAGDRSLCRIDTVDLDTGLRTDDIGGRDELICADEDRGMEEPRRVKAGEALLLKVAHASIIPSMSNGQAIQIVGDT